MQLKKSLRKQIRMWKKDTHEGDRTLDHTIKSRALYRTELHRLLSSCSITLCNYANLQSGSWCSLYFSIYSCFSPFYFFRCWSCWIFSFLLLAFYATAVFPYPAVFVSVSLPVHVPPHAAVVVVIVVAGLKSIHLLYHHSVWLLVQRHLFCVHPLHVCFIPLKFDSSLVYVYLRVHWYPATSSEG